LKRVEGQDVAVESPIGYLPKQKDFNLEGLEVKWDELFSTPKDFWKKEVTEIKQYFEDNVGEDLPAQLGEQAAKLEKRLE
jgi:phosphoenolpyruvate carboxykinase (GTP)